MHETNHLTTLPVELLANICKELTIKDLQRLSKTSSQLRNIFSDPHFYFQLYILRGYHNLTPCRIEHARDDFLQMEKLHFSSNEPGVYAWFIDAQLGNVGAMQSQLDKYKNSIFKFLQQDPFEYVDRQRNTALHWAAINGNARLLKFLIANEPSINPDLQSINKPNYLQATPLSLAVKFGHRDCVQILLDAGAKPTLVEYRSPLGSAVINGDLQMVDLLLQNNFDINEQIQVPAIDSGDSMLMLAVKAKNLDLVKYLLDHGARIDLTNSYGLNIAHVAAEYYFAPIWEIIANLDANLLEARAIRNHSIGSNILYYAARGGSEECLYDILARDLNIDITGGFPDALSCAYYAGHSSLVKKLITNGANFYASKEHFLGLISKFVFKNDWAMLDLIFSKLPYTYEDQNVTADVVETILFKLIPAENDRLFLNLLKQFLDLELPKEQEILNNLLIHAVRSDKLTILHGLISAGADLDCKTTEYLAKEHVRANYEIIPLGLAILDENSESLQLLIEYTDNINAMFFNNELNPLMLAAANGNLVALRMLLAAGADPSLVNIHGNTALDIAEEHCQDEIMRELMQDSLAFEFKRFLRPFKRLISSRPRFSLNKILTPAGAGLLICSVVSFGLSFSPTMALITISLGPLAAALGIVLASVVAVGLFQAGRYAKPIITKSVSLLNKSIFDYGKRLLGYTDAARINIDFSNAPALHSSQAIRRSRGMFGMALVRVANLFSAKDLTGFNAGSNDIQVTASTPLTVIVESSSHLELTSLLHDTNPQSDAQTSAITAETYTSLFAEPAPAIEEDDSLDIIVVNEQGTQIDRARLEA